MFFCVLAGLLIGPSASAQDGWPYYGGNQGHERHAMFSQINKDSVARLVPRRVLQLGAQPYSLSASPLVVDGILYVSSSDGIAQAFDLRTGMRKWSFQHKMKLPGEVSPVYGTAGPACCSNTSRGVAYANGSIFLATLDAKLVSIDAETGKKQWEVWGVRPEDNKGGIYGYNSAAMAIGDMVVIGTTGGESPTRHHLTAFDQKTGKQVWRWYSIPAPDGSDPVAPKGWWGDFAEETAYGQKTTWRNLDQEKADKEKYRESWRIGAGSLWMPVSYDKELDLIFVGTGNANPDMDGRGRPGDNLFTCSIVAIDAKTGKTRWYFQIEPHGLWDRDEVSPPVVTMLEGRKVIVHAGKTGIMFVLDARTGEYIRKSEIFVPHNNMWVAPTDKPVTVTPGAAGGNEWSPISVDSKRKLGFVGGLNLAVEYTRGKDVDISEHLGRSTKGLTLGGSWIYDMKSAMGYFSAIDLTTGKIKWQNKTPLPFIGGVMSTSTGLVFQGENDGHLTAFDSDTGDTLWRFNTGAGVNAPPIGFTLDGEEFVAVCAGGSSLWGSPKGGCVFVFGLPKVWSPAAVKQAPGAEPRERIASWIVRHAGWVLLVCGILTATMLIALIAPRKSFSVMFGETVDGKLGELISRNWGQMIFATGLLLIYAACREEARLPVLLFASFTKLTFATLVISNCKSYRRTLAMKVASGDVIMVGLFVWYLVAAS
jgi:PQQ-dependent dehydrogenase (methanol/ethanol family)